MASILTSIGSVVGGLFGSSDTNNQLQLQQSRYQGIQYQKESDANRKTIMYLLIALFIGTVVLITSLNKNKNG